MNSDAKRSILWSGIQNIANQGIHFVITVIIARLLKPEDYGLVAMLSIFYALAQAFIDSGLTGALIQKKDCTEKDYNSVFIFVVTISSILYIILFLCAPLIAQMYHNDTLIIISRVYLTCLVINALGVVPMTIMHKDLQFKQFAYITTTINLIAGVIAIILAYCGLAYWALVTQILITSALSTISYYVKTKWIPTFLFSVESFKSMISYGFPVMLTSIVHAIYNNLYSLVIGAKYNSTELGFYNRSYSFASIVPTTFSNFTMRAMFPILIRIQDNLNELRGKVLDMLHHSLYVVVPINVYLIFNTKDIIKIVLGNNWLELSPYLTILSISCISYIYTNMHMSTFKTIGKTKNLFVSECVRKVLGLITILITTPLGIMTMMNGLLAYAILDILISAYFLNKCIKIGILNQIKVSVTPILFSISAGLSAWFIASMIPHQLFLRFILSILTFGGTYILLSILFKEKSVIFIKNYFK